MQSLTLRHPIVHNHGTDAGEPLQFAGNEFRLEFSAIDQRFECRSTLRPRLHVERARRDVEKGQDSAHAPEQIRVRVGDDAERSGTFRLKMPDAFAQGIIARIYISGHCPIDRATASASSSTRRMFPPASFATS